MIALLAALIGLQQPQGAQAVAELLQARQWTIVDGLPQSSVNDLAVSSSGELWLATFGGLVAFDGTRFRSHDIDAVQDLPSNRITALARGEGSDLWLTTQSGELVRMQAGKVLEVHHLPGGPTEALCLLRHPDGGLWVQTSSGAVLIFKTGAWTEVVSGGLGGSYEGMCLIGDGDVITSRGRILMRLDANGRELQRWEAGVRITAVGSTRRGEVWVGLQKGLALLKSGELLPWTGKTQLDQAVLVLHEGADGSMFVGTRRGLYQLHAAQGGGLVGPLGPESLGAIEVRSICLDPEGNLWLGTSASGLVRLRPSRIESLPALQMLGGVSALAPDGQGGLWVGQECRGLTHVEAGTRACLTEPAPILGGVEHCPFALSRDSRGRLWLGSSTAVLRRETVDAPWQPIVPRDVLGERAGPMLELDDGEYLVTSQAGMLLRLDAGDRIIQRQVLPGAIHSLLRAHDGSVWIGSDGQLMQWTPQSLRVLGSEQGIPRCAVRDLLQGGDGVLWLATYGAGLLSWKGDKLRSFSRSQGLPDTALNKLASDGVRLWASSNLGLIVFEWSELEEWRSGRRERIDPIIYGPESGLEETNYGQPSGLQLEDGSLWFGTLSGVARVDPARFPFNPHPPAPRIEQILVDDESLAEPYEIPAGSRRLVIEYGAISLTAADRVRYRYRLQGFDDSWEEAGRTQQASFTDLKPGDYRLEFQARNEDGIWSQSALSPSLRVLPRWWQRTPVQVIGVLTTAGLLFLLHRLRIRSLSRRTEALVAATRGRMEAEERESRLREELAHVARVATAGELASSLAHEVNQPLGAIVHNTHAAQILLERGKQSDVREILSDIGSQAERASTVIRRLREFLRKDPGRREVIDLNQLIDATMPLMRREIADSRVRVSLELALALPGVQADPVQMQQVLVNLIKNACEALARVPGERRMVIRTMHEAGRVAFEVVDNGPGLAPGVSERLFQPYVTTKHGGMGLGLAICRSIMEAHGGHLLAQRGREQGLVLRGDLPLHS